MFAFHLMTQKSYGIWARVNLPQGNSLRIFADGINSDGYGAASHTFMTYCNQGERVSVEADSGSTSRVWGPNYCSFSGMLISAGD